MKEKKKINVKKRISNVGENHGFYFFFFFLKKENIFQSKEEKYAAVGKSGLCVQT